MSDQREATNAMASRKGTIVCPVCSRRVHWELTLMEPFHPPGHYGTGQDRAVYEPPLEEIRASTGINRPWRCPECARDIVVCWRLDLDDDPDEDEEEEYLTEADEDRIIEEIKQNAGLRYDPEAPHPTFEQLLEIYGGEQKLRKVFEDGHLQWPKEYEEKLAAKSSTEHVELINTPPIDAEDVAKGAAASAHMKMEGKKPEIKRDEKTAAKTSGDLVELVNTPPIDAESADKCAAARVSVKIQEKIPAKKPPPKSRPTKAQADENRRLAHNFRLHEEEEDDSPEQPPGQVGKRPNNVSARGKITWYGRKVKSRKRRTGY